MFTQNIAIDLGTANTIIIVDGQIVVDEPAFPPTVHRWPVHAWR